MEQTTAESYLRRWEAQNESSLTAAMQVMSLQSDFAAEHQEGNDEEKEDKEQAQTASASKEAANEEDDSDVKDEGKGRATSHWHWSAEHRQYYKYCEDGQMVWGPANS
jgi:hypothetical protein